MKRVVVSALAAATMLCATSAFAGDLSGPNGYTRVHEQPASGYNWSGVYVGGNLGYGSSRIKDTYVDPFTSTNSSYSAKGLTYGAEVKVLYEFNNNIVIGAATDINSGGGSGHQTIDNCLGGCFGLSSGTTNTYKKEWWGSTRGVLGYDLERFMLYVTGGVAYASINTRSVTNYSGGGISGNYTVSNTSYGVGGIYGVGVAYNINESWTASLEGLRAQYGINSQSDTTPSKSRTSLTDNVVRAGVQFHF